MGHDIYLVNDKNKILHFKLGKLNNYSFYIKVTIQAIFFNSADAIKFVHELETQKEIERKLQEISTTKEVDHEDDVCPSQYL